MSYEKQTWNKYDDLKTEEENIENGAVVTDNRMNHIEEGIEAHTTDFKNPHKVTAAQVGLGNVQNFGLATEDEAKQGISNAKYMTPSLTQAVLSANINSIAYAYSSDGTDRFTTVYPNLNLLKGTRVPISLTGKNETNQRNFLYWFDNSKNVQNQDFSVGDTLTCKFDWTVTKPTSGTFLVQLNEFNWQYLSKIISITSENKSGHSEFSFVVDSSFLSGIANGVQTRIDNLPTDSVLTISNFLFTKGSTATPHMPSASEVTTADWPKYVGFSNTVKTNKSASDYAWFPVKDSELTNKVDSHVNNKANPHSVTASQVGAYTKDESDQKLAAQKQAIDSHVNNKSNPHTVTASQVGAYSKQEIDTKLSKAVMADDSGKVTVKTLQVETIKSNSDTDLLNLSLTGVASATFSYIRINGIVYITAAGNWGNFPDNKQRIVGNIPAGFRPPTDWGTGMNPQGGSRLLSAVIKANGDLGVTSDAAQNNVYGQFSMSYPGI
ncbi:hypothetical protein [Lactococcus lactis]|uniref:hypothetical protein n=1 Tax=Lactococcus lactis TaxID=1358 RepID=UPI000536A5D4|nr:hypothetical protein [Lactococcus lactis]KHE76801.1 hypothetical protein N489_07470 [Lactococcus lactis subsp. lactis 1AA59]UBU73698.1 hypothetical protein I6G24_02330 [Lactococcus lactis]